MEKNGEGWRSNEAGRVTKRAVIEIYEGREEGEREGERGREGRRLDGGGEGKEDGEKGREIGAGWNMTRWKVGEITCTYTSNKRTAYRTRSIP